MAFALVLVFASVLVLLSRGEEEEEEGKEDVASSHVPWSEQMYPPGHTEPPCAAPQRLSALHREHAPAKLLLYSAMNNAAAAEEEEEEEAFWRRSC